MPSSDDQLLTLLRAHGVGPEHLFIAGGLLYTSEDGGDFRANSTYSRIPQPLLEVEGDLLDLSRRLALPEFSSTGTVDTAISQFKDWERLYERLTTILSKHGSLNPVGDGDFFLIDDYYGSPQHKVECTSSAVFTPELVADVQAELLVFSEDWEVIFVFSSPKGNDRATSVYKNRCEYSEA
jgi:hypothetical protein